MQTQIGFSAIALCTLAFCLTWCQAMAIQPQVQSSSYANRIVFIRHAEKGFVGDVNDTVSGASANPPHRQGDEHNLRDPRLSSFWPPWGREGRHGKSKFPGRPGGSGGPRHKFPSGLNDNGRQRAQFLRILFGTGSEFDFGKIFAAPRELPKETERTYATVAPLAQDLGLEIDVDCANTAASCIVRKIEEFVAESSKDILISWKHRDLNVIATALGVQNAKIHYPDERYDILWIMEHGEIVKKRSMHCPGLDDDRVDDGDPDLEIETASGGTWPWSLFPILRSVVYA